jgi:AhpD family alkylhydroperoxidase
MKKRKPVVPQHVSDFLNLFHNIVFHGSDGEENFVQYLTLTQKECISLALSIYYQCSHCIDYHVRALSKLKSVKEEVLFKHVASMILFLRTDISRTSKPELDRWLETWDQLSLKIATKYRDDVVPDLVGLSVGVARNDELLIKMFGKRIDDYFKVKSAPVMGELISVVLFMKAATSKNRIIDKIERILDN